jgi:hypothetical protein
MTMLSLSVLSRRALIAVAALLATAPNAAAAKKKPLAFVATVASDVEEGTDATTFRWTLQSELSHPASGITTSISGVVIVPVEATEKETRARMVADVRTDAASILQSQNQEVPENRIAVVLL